MKRLLAGLVAFVCLACLAVTAYAQPENPAKGPATSTRNLLGTKPAVEWDAQWPLPELNRTLYIHRADQSATGNERTWVHRPLFAFVTRPEPYADLPKIVLAREPEENGAETLTFEVLVTSEALRLHLSHVLLNPDFSKRPPALNVPDIFMVSWPLEDVVVDCRTNTNQRLLGTASGGRSLASIKDRFRFHITFGAAELAELQRRFDDGTLVFDFRYTFTNRQVAELEENSRANRELALSVQGQFTDQQRSGAAPIFQSDVNRAMSWLKVNFVRDIRVTDARLLPVIKENMVLSLLFARQTMTFDEIEQDEKLRAAVAKHLEPLIDTLTQETTTKDETVDTKTKRKTETIELDFSKAVSLSAGPTGSVGGETKGSGKYTLQKEKLNTLELTTGVTFKETDVKNRYAPQSITVYRLNQGKDNVQIAGTERVFLALGTLVDYFVDSEVPANFTESAVLKALAQPATAPIYDGVPLGTMLPYLGGTDAPPRGYVFADGKSNWPELEWVALHLRGKAMPDMNGKTAFGFAGTEQLGLVQTGNTPKFATAKVDAPALAVSTGSITALTVDFRPRKEDRKQDVEGELAVPLFPRALSERLWSAWQYGGNGNRPTFSPHWQVDEGPLGTRYAGAARLTTHEVVSGVSYTGDKRTIPSSSVIVDAGKLTPTHVGVRWIIRVY